ncbi:MAG: GNAT family N-acetyltransferase [Chitinophagaceae bacterium]|nr:MAG: GNAT family N-acetyltransferase [Chitinophagaceae bacterium]
MKRITPATIQDLKTLTEVGRRSLLESHGHSAPAAIMQAYVDEKFTQNALEQELSDPQNIFHIIWHNDQPAGYSKIIYCHSLPQVPQKNITKMERLYLLQEYYSLKLGQQLLQFNIDLSKHQGEAGMWLYVWKENERAMRFYTKAGFKIIGDGLFRLTDEHANPNWQMLLTY